MTLVLWMRGLTLAAGLALPAAAASQETAESAAARPVVPIPDVIVPDQSQSRGLPQWSDFPVPPVDVPTVKDFGDRVNTQKAVSAQLAKEVGALVWDKEKPDSYAEAARRRISPQYTRSIDPKMSRPEIEALGAELRRRATPPPIADL